MAKLRIGMDLDGVVIDFTRGCYEAMCEMTGTRPPVDFSTLEWDWPKRLFGEQVYHEFWIQIAMAQPEFWSELPSLLNRHERDQLFRLADAHEVYFITNRPNGMLEPTVAWLKRELSITFNGTVAFTHGGQVILSGKKGLIARGIGLDWMIDDKPENLMHVVTQSPDTKCMLVHQSWNASSHTSPHMKRVFEFAEILSTLERGF